ncbi:VENN motif pre-toxin domain-containing protein [Pseudomonas protegens]|uniref:VENN motif pre-toxin domain-containing protein n=1 Tax=Pseudomonas protegens TaxID=380021 RepID=UPI00223F1D37|nr:VENN motif pre-toxin domain-containing protein [Pseudomonas protegens]
MITQQLYGTSDTSSLSEEQKQTVAVLSTLAAGLAGGIAKGDSAGAIAGAGAGKNAVENNHLGTGVNIFGHQLGKDQVAEFGNELKASCGDSGGLQACLKTYDTWKETSYRQGGLETKEAQAGWEEFVQAVYTEKVLPLCKGNAACERNVATHMAVTTVTYAGDSVGIGQAIGEATRAVNLANGNWVRVGLQVVEDASLLATLGSMVGVFSKVGSAGGAGQAARNPNPTSALTDAETGISKLPKVWDVPDTTINKFPASWAVSPNKKGTGFRWQDPQNKGNGVRVDKGEPHISQPTQQVDHVIVRSNGQVIGRDGKPVIGSIKDHAEQVHIPLSEYKKWKTWNSPN